MNCAPPIPAIGLWRALRMKTSKLSPVEIRCRFPRTERSHRVVSRGVVKRHVRHALAAPEGNLRPDWRMIHLHFRQRCAVGKIPQADKTRLRQVTAYDQIAEIVSRRVIGRHSLPEFTITGKPERNGIAVARKVARLAAVQRRHGCIGHMPQRSAERKGLRRAALIQRLRRRCKVQSSCWRCGFSTVEIDQHLFKP